MFYFGVARKRNKNLFTCDIFLFRIEQQAGRPAASTRKHHTCSLRNEFSLKEVLCFHDMLSLLPVLFVGRGFEVYAISQHLSALKHGLMKVMCL